MTVNEIIKEFLHKRKWTQAELAKECDFKGQSSIGMILRRNNVIQVDTLLRILDAMGCELIVRDKFDKGNEMVITMESDEDAK